MKDTVWILKKYDPIYQAWLIDKTSFSPLEKIGNQEKVETIQIKGVNHESPSPRKTGRFS